MRYSMKGDNFDMKNLKYFGFEMSNPKNFAEWQYVEFNEFEKGLRYGRFCISPLTKDQCELIKTALRQALLTEILCARFTHAKIQNSSNNLMNIVGIEESIPEILHNLSQIRLKGNLEDLASHGPFVAILDLEGPITAMAIDIELPRGLKVVKESHHIATITKPIPLFIELRIEIHSGEWNRETPVPDEEGYSIDATFTPIHKVDSRIQSYSYEGIPFQSLFLDIWSERPTEPLEALLQASNKIRKLFMSVLGAESVDSKELDNGLHFRRFAVYPLTAAQCKWIQTALRQALLTDISGEWNRETRVTDEEGDSIDPTFTPIHKVDSSIQSYEDEGENETFQRLLIGIWTDSQIEPQEALWQASAKILELFLIFLQIEKENKKYLERKLKERAETLDKHRPGPPGWKEGLSLSRGWINQIHRFRDKILFMNAETIWLLTKLKKDYETYKLIGDSILQELRASLNKLKKIQKLQKGYSEQKILVDSIVQEMDAPLNKHKKELSGCQASLTLRKIYISWKEVEIDSFEGTLLSLHEDQERIKTLPQVDVDRALSQKMWDVLEMEELKKESLREENERLRKRREEREKRKHNRKKDVIDS
uniref:RNA polymerase alpha subunit n=1 Tax=Pelargonium transvaalense TaxID=158603 RepID=A0A1B0PY47_9ROSI|nr:RNA polymerase alpha subunit [Pelargonium transvaalense]YP_009300185.1 RNA polymerase alpha subunit [Pelargonium transvaalense]AJC00054.1 RNA polymerase alpha subunit [Pelargonium transvaalense]AJC00100.1 RNA polymerase alpha subunit [Pelargonium transvaalense]